MSHIYLTCMPLMHHSRWWAYG